MRQFVELLGALCTGVRTMGSALDKPVVLTPESYLVGLLTYAPDNNRATR